MSHKCLSQLSARDNGTGRPLASRLAPIATVLLCHSITIRVADAGPIQAYVSNFDEGTVSVIDAETFSVTATLPVGERPVGIVAHPDGSRVYVASRDSNTLSVIDATINEVTATVPMAGGPFGIVISADGSRVYVANRNVGIVQVVDTETNRVISDISASASGDVAVHPDGSFVYATAGENVNVIDAATNEVIDSIRTSLGAVPWTVDVHPDGSRLYVNNSPFPPSGRVGVIDTGTNTAISRIRVGQQSTGIAVHPDGNSVYISNRADDTVSVIDTETDSVTDTISVQRGSNPRGLAVHPSGQLLYVTNNNRGSVSSINLLTNEVLGTIRVGRGPDIGITFAQDLGFPATTRHVAGWNTIERDDRVTNIAPLGIAMQSSDRSTRSIASNAIDGDLTTDARTNADDAQHRWQVDLGDASRVVGMRVHNGGRGGQNLTNGGGFRAELLREDDSVAWRQDVIGDDLPTGTLDLEIGEDGARVSGNVLRLSKLSPVVAGTLGSFRLAEVELFSDSLTLELGETWAFEIDAATDASDVLGVAGSLHIDGSDIIVSLLDGEPLAGDVFDIIDAGEITGAFNAVTLPPLKSSLQWHTDALNVDGTLAVTFRGDFDNSGDFNAPDIDQLSAAVGNAGGGVFDLTGDGRVDQADRAHWVAEIKKTWTGDSNLDGEFNSGDIVNVLQAGKFDTIDTAGWSDGDWDGNQVFDRDDIIVALQDGGYGQGTRVASAEQAAGGNQQESSFAAIAPGGSTGDGQTSLVYVASSGELSLDAPAGVELTSINVDSTVGIFTGVAAQNLGGSFDNDADANIFKATFGGSFGSVSFGNVARTGLSEQFVLNDLNVVGSLEGGGDLGSVDLVYVPEPAALGLLAFGLLVFLPRLRQTNV